MKTVDFVFLIVLGFSGWVGFFREAKQQLY